MNLNFEQFADLLKNVPDNARIVEVDSPLDDDTAKMCEMAYAARKRISVYLHTAHVLGSEQLESFRAKAGQWLGNVELVHPQAGNNAELKEEMHNDRSVSILILNDMNKMAKWSPKVICTAGQIMFRR